MNKAFHRAVLSVIQECRDGSWRHRAKRVFCRGAWRYTCTTSSPTRKQICVNLCVLSSVIEPTPFFPDPDFQPSYTASICTPLASSAVNPLRLRLVAIELTTGPIPRRGFLRAEIVFLSSWNNCAPRLDLQRIPGFRKRRRLFPDCMSTVCSCDVRVDCIECTSLLINVLGILIRRTVAMIISPFLREEYSWHFSLFPQIARTLISLLCIRCSLQPQHAPVISSPPLPLLGSGTTYGLGSYVVLFDAGPTLPKASCQRRSLRDCSQRNSVLRFLRPEGLFFFPVARGIESIAFGTLRAFSSPVERLLRALLDQETGDQATFSP